MNTSNNLLLLLSLSFFGACSTSTQLPFVDRQYTIGEEREATRGEDLFVVRTGKRCTNEKFIGLAFGGMATDTWEEDVHEKRLTFDGVRDGAIEASFVHKQTPVIPIEVNTSRNPMVRPEFLNKLMQAGHTDSRRIEFEAGERTHAHSGVRFEILDVDRVKIRYRIVGDSFVQPAASGEDSQP